MRKVQFKERTKRGCLYCADIVKKRNRSTYDSFYCKHNNCPYQETDNYDSYIDYLTAEAGNLTMLLYGLKKSKASKIYE